MNQNNKKKLNQYREKRKNENYLLEGIIAIIRSLHPKPRKGLCRKLSLVSHWKGGELI